MNILIGYPLDPVWGFRSIRFLWLSLQSKQTRLKNEHYLMRQDNTIKYKTFSINLSFSSIGQDKSKPQKQISKLLILIATTAW